MMKQVVVEEDSCPCSLEEEEEQKQAELVEAALLLAQLMAGLNLAPPQAPFYLEGAAAGMVAGLKGRSLAVHGHHAVVVS